MSPSPWRPSSPTLSVRAQPPMRQSYGRPASGCGAGCSSRRRSLRCSFCGGMGRGPRSAGMPVRRPGRGRRGNGHDLDDGRLPRTYTKASCSTGRRGLIPSRPPPAPRRVPWSPGPGWRGVGLLGGPAARAARFGGLRPGGTSAPGEHPVRGAHRFLEGDPRRARRAPRPGPLGRPRSIPDRPRADRAHAADGPSERDSAPRGGATSSARTSRPAGSAGRASASAGSASAAAPPDHRGFSRHGPRSRSGDPRRPVLEGVVGLGVEEGLAGGAELAGGAGLVRARARVGRAGRTGRRRHRAPQSTAARCESLSGPSTTWRAARRRRWSPPEGTRSRPDLAREPEGDRPVRPGAWASSQDRRSASGPARGKSAIGRRGHGAGTARSDRAARPARRGPDAAPPRTRGASPARSASTSEGSPGRARPRTPAQRTPARRMPAPGARRPRARDGRDAPRPPRPPSRASSGSAARGSGGRGGATDAPTRAATAQNPRALATPSPPTPSPPATAAKTPAGTETPARSERPTRRATRDAPGPGPDRRPPPPETEPRGAIPKDVVEEMGPLRRMLRKDGMAVS